MLKQIKNVSGLTVVGALLASCSIYEAEVPEEVLEEHPVAHPVRALTGFSDGLVCLGRMLQERKVQTIYITSDDIPDYSENNGSAGYGAKEMMVSALSRLSEENGLVRYVAYDRRTPNIVALHNSHPKKQNLRIPDFFIRGAITQIQTSPYSKQLGHSLNLGEGALGNQAKNFLGAGISNSNSVSVSSVTLDMNMGLMSNYQILPGVNSSNTMSVTKKGDSSEITVSFTKVGGIYSDNENRAGALSNAMRSLIEVGMVELIGKLYNVPYEDCLASLDKNSIFATKIREKYDSLSKSERYQFVGNEMYRQGLIKADDPILEDGEPTEEFQLKIASYRVKNGLYPNTSVDYRLFEKAYLQSKQAPKTLKGGEGVGPLKRWLHVGVGQ